METKNYVSLNNLATFADNLKDLYVVKDELEDVLSEQNDKIASVETSVEEINAAVLYTPQTLTDEQKAQARANIGAIHISVTDDDEGNVEIIIATESGGEEIDYSDINNYPVTDTLVGLYDLGGTAEASLINHANADIVPTVTGTVGYEPNYAVFSGAPNASRINTNVQLDIANNPIAYIALFRVPIEQSYSVRPIVGNRRNTSPNAIGIDMKNGVVEYCTNNTTKISDTQSLKTNNFIILAMTASTAGYTLYRYANGNLDTLETTETAVDSWTYPFANNNIRIGGNSLSSATTVEAHISLVALHEGVFGDGELENVCEFVYNYGVSKGLTIE